MKGWFGNKKRHSLASKGIHTCINSSMQEFPDYLDEDDDLEEIMYEYNKCIGEDCVFGARAYAGTRHYDMNHFLLTGEETNEYIDNEGVVRWNQKIMERAIEEFKEYLRKAPKYTGEVWRGMGIDFDYKLDKELIDKIQKTKKSGKKLNFGTFLSTSNEYDNAYNYIYGKEIPMMIYIHSGNNSGVYFGGAIHKFYDDTEDYTENEVVFSPDAKFKIINFDKEEYSFFTFRGLETKDGYYLELEEV